MKFTRNLCGSKLEILIQSEGEFSSLVEEAFKIGEDFENKYSRFIKGNYLSELNVSREATIDTEFKSILQLCLKVSEITNGCYDITIQPILENLGYGIEDNKVSENIGYKNIIIRGDKVLLKNGVSIDLGSVGKGFIVDKIYNFLDEKIENFIVNFGGDIRVKGEKNIGLENPYQSGKTIGSISLKNHSIASSNGKKRVFYGNHHLINAQNMQPQNDKIAIYVTHKLGVFADVFATALFITPLKDSLNILANIPGLEAIIIDFKGKIYKSKGFNFKI